MTRSPRTLLALLSGTGVVVLALAAGCGTNAPPGPATVRGKLTFNGRPVAGGLVVFAPDPRRGGRGKPVSAETGPDGGYRFPLDRSPPVPAGWYRVALMPAAPGPPGAGVPFPPQLARPDLSGLEREVRAGQEHVFDFAVSATE
jgi:hypothetical protein